MGKLAAPAIVAAGRMMTLAVIEGGWSRRMKPSVLIALLGALFCGTAVPQPQARTAKTTMTLTLDEILSCTTGPAQELLERSVDNIRRADVSAVTTLDDPNITIHWSLAGDLHSTHKVAIDEDHPIESLQEIGFCRNGALKLVFFGSQRERSSQADSELRVGEIVRDGEGYNFSPQQVYSGNHSFSQEKGIFANSDQQFLLINLEPLTCVLHFTPVDGGKTVDHRFVKSEIGVSLQWTQGKVKDKWVFYRAMYDSGGKCP